MKKDSKLTGFPSIDKPWPKYYASNAYENSLEIPNNCTVWDMIEESLLKHISIPAIEYFGRKISRSEFIESVYLWAKALKAIGINEDDVVPIYSPFLPDVFSITCALNLIGATPYFLKLEMSKKDFLIETKETHYAIIYDRFWNNIKDVFQSEQFEKIFIITGTETILEKRKSLKSLFCPIKKQKKAKFIRANDAKKWLVAIAAKLKPILR